MKIFYFTFLLITSASVYSQNKAEIDSINSVEKLLFIKDYTNRFNVKFEVSNDIPVFDIPFENKSVKIEPNLNAKYAFVLSYKFATIRLGVRPKNSPSSQNEKGNPKTFRLKFKLIFDKWSHHFEYSQVQGYYITNSKTINNHSNTDIYLQFPDLKTMIFSGTTAYKLNDNYSVRATVSQTEVQLKSTGSLIPSFTYTFYNINGLDTYINYDKNQIDRDFYTDNSGFTGSFNVGYHYTFVYKKWNASVFAAPGIGYDFRKVTSYSPNLVIKNNYNALLFAMDVSAGIGYNAEKIFFGTSINHKNRDYRHSEKSVEFQTSKISFVIFLGYRFNAPKVVTKPIDGLENKLRLQNK